MTYITRNLNQDLVYWSPATDDGFGNKTFPTPIQIKGRWEDYIEVVKNKMGEQIVSKAKLYIDRPVMEHGYIIKGVLFDYQDSNPLEIDAEEILKYEEIPNIRNTEILARARM